MQHTFELNLERLAEGLRELDLPESEIESFASESRGWRTRCSERPNRASEVSGPGSVSGNNGTRSRRRSTVAETFLWHPFAAMGEVRLEELIIDRGQDV